MTIMLDTNIIISAALFPARANAAASIVIGRKGALLMMPSEAEIMQALPAR